MKRSILLACGVVGALAGASPAQDDKIELFADQGMSGCELAYNGPELRSVYVFHTGTQGAFGAQFTAPKPSCWTGATWIGDAIAPPFLVLGSTQGDFAISYGDCLQPPIYLGAINYFVSSAGPTCCLYSALPSPISPAPGSIVVFDCNLVDLRLASAGSKVMINPTPDCPNCEPAPPPPPPPPSPVHAIELFADQTMSSCELVATPGQFKSIYMFHTGPGDATSSEFGLPKPACWPNAVMTGVVLPPDFLYIGDVQTDITISYGGCKPLPLYLGRIDYFVTASDGACCPFPVLPSPVSPIPGSIAIETCDLPPNNVIAADAGQQVMINPNANCPNCDLGTVRTSETTWGRVKALYARP